MVINVHYGYKKNSMIKGYLFYHNRIIYLLLGKLLQIAPLWGRKSTKYMNLGMAMKSFTR